MSAVPCRSEAQDLSGACARVGLVVRKHKVTALVVAVTVLFHPASDSKELRAKPRGRLSAKSEVVETGLPKSQVERKASLSERFSLRLSLFFFFFFFFFQRLQVK